MSAELVFEKGLPANLDAERYTLGSILLNADTFDGIAAVLTPEDFSLRKNRLIFERMLDLADRGEPIDRVTVANELQSQGQLDAVEGLTYLVSLDDGLPEIANLDAYVRIVQDKAIKRRAILAHQRFIDELLLDDSESAEVLARSERAISDLRTLGRSNGGFQTVEQIIHASGGIDEFLSPRALAGAPTPWRGLNGFLTGGGFSGGQLIVVGGRPGQGKTALAANLATFCAQQLRVFFVSLEMSSREILRRMVCASAQVNLMRLSQRNSESTERHDIAVALDAMTDASQPGLRILDQPKTSVMSLRSELRRESAQYPVGMVIVDYLQLMDTPGRRNVNRTEAVGEITRGLKLLARELNCRMVLLSQLSRGSAKEDKEPELTDLRDSGEIEQDADIVMFPYSKKIVGEMPEVIPYELLLRKQRNGPVGRCSLNFFRKNTRFADA